MAAAPPRATHSPPRCAPVCARRLRNIGTATNNRRYVKNIDRGYRDFESLDIVVKFADFGCVYCSYN